MSDNKRLIRKIICDCGKIMRMVVFFYILESVLNEYISIYTASVLGKLADAVLKLDTSFGMQQFWKIVGCVLLSVILLPLLETIAEMMMFQKSLTHDQMLLQRFFNKTYTAYSKLGVGDIQYHLDDDACDFRILWVQLVTKGITVPVALIYLLYHTLPVSILYTFIVFAVSLFQLVVPVAAHKLRKKYDQQTREYHAKIRIYETDMTTKPHMIRILGLKKAWIERFDKFFQDYYRDIFVKYIRYLVMADTIQKFVNTFCLFIILMSGAIMASQNRIVSGLIVAMMGYFSVFCSIISDIGFIIRNIPILMNLANRLKEIYEGEERQGGMAVEEVRSITVENLSFLYEYSDSNEHTLSENVVVFENVNFNMGIGIKMAVCGRNGSGKSTLLKVLCGLLEKYNGNMYINEQSFSDIDLKSWRNQVSYIEQEPFLFTGSVFENIRIGNLEASQTFIEQIMEEVGIAHLSDYVVEANMVGLSGGERQKISIARALLKDAPILLMDEPNNNLDEEMLLWLQNFIINVPKTVIFISHDSELMKGMEYKIVLE